MGYMDMEGSGPSSAAKEHLPTPVQPTALSSPPQKFVIPVPEVPDSDSDFEVMCYHMHLCIVGSDSGDRKWRLALTVQGAPHHRLNMPRPRPSSCLSPIASNGVERSLSQPAASSASERPSRRTASQVWHYFLIFL